MCSTDYVANRVEAWRESSYPPVAVEQAETADAIVPLSGIFGPRVPEGFLPNIGESGERLEAGIQLWQHKKAPWLVFTGGRMPWRPAEELEGALSARLAIARGIPEASIVVTSEVGNTADEADAIARLVRERGWHKILLVTSANHMQRAASQFRDAGVTTIPFPVDFHVDAHRPAVVLDFVPNSASLHQTENAIREWYGSLFYRVARILRRKG